MKIAVPLPSEPRAASVARTLLRQWLSAMGLQSVLDDAELVVTELVANAVRYGRPPLTLQISREGSALRIAVADSDIEHPPAPRDAGEFDTGGRGLRLVEALTVRWGCDIEGDRKLVWADFLLTT